MSSSFHLRLPLCRKRRGQVCHTLEERSGTKHARAAGRRTREPSAEHGHCDSVRVQPPGRDFPLVLFSTFPQFGVVVVLCCLVLLLIVPSFAAFARPSPGASTDIVSFSPAARWASSEQKLATTAANRPRAPPRRQHQRRRRRRRQHPLAGVEKGRTHRARRTRSSWRSRRRSRRPGEPAIPNAHAPCQRQTNPAAAISLPAFNRFCVFVLRSEKLPVRLQLRRLGGAVQWHRHTQRM